MVYNGRYNTGLCIAAEGLLSTTCLMGDHRLACLLLLELYSFISGQ